VSGSPFDTQELPLGGGPPAPPPPPPPPSPWRKHRMAIIAGAGGLLVVLGLVFAIVTFASGRDDRDGDGGRETEIGDVRDEEQEQEQEQEDEQEEEPPPITKPPLEASSVRELIAEDVGRYYLVKAGKDPVLRQNGALEAYEMIYASSGGSEMYHALGAFESSGDADDQRELTVGNLRDSGYKIVLDEPLEVGGEPNGGRLTALTNPEGLGASVWSNGPLFAMTVGPDISQGRFFRTLPY